jgi:hypothetical protein
MDSHEAIERMCAQAGRSKRSLSLDMGRSEKFIQVYTSTARRPSSDVLADIAHACGYRLQLVGHGETIDIDGTRRETGDAGED